LINAATTVAVGATAVTAITDTTNVNTIDLTAAGITYHATNALTITGGAGADAITLRAGAGSLDTVVLNVIATSDTIGGYVVADDSIQLSKAAMAGLGAVGALGAGEFETGAGLVAAATVAGRIVYNSTTGVVYYDADGSGAGAAVMIATITGTPTIAVGEFAIIA
jgi:Ca2+-binding RTX toxin-like protein